MLQIAQLGQPVTVHGVKQQARLASHLQRALGACFAEHVLGHTGVGAAVFGVGIQDVKRHEAKVIGGAEAMTLGHSFAIEEPLDAHGAVVDWRERGLKVGRLALLQDNVLEGVAKLGRLGGGQLFLGRPLVLGLKMLNLLQGFLVLRIEQQTLAS